MKGVKRVFNLFIKETPIQLVFRRTLMSTFKGLNRRFGFSGKFTLSNARFVGLLIVFIITNLAVGCEKYRTNMNDIESENEKLIKISVFEYRSDDSYIAGISNDLKKIQAENSDKVYFTFYDGKNSQVIENQNIDKAIKDGTDLLLVNLVDIKAGQEIINRIKENNIPVILYNREPITLEPIKSYSKAIYIGNDSREGGALQGKILIDEWNSKKQIIDRNRDGIMQYIMLSGGTDNKEAIGRTIYSVKTIEDAGIKTEQLALRVANWDEELAEKATESLFFKYGNNIEVIISNDDTMAIGAIKALQSMGYNNGDVSRTIPVVGFDAEEEARKLIEQGFMTGSVIQSTYSTAEALYSVGMNMASNKNPLEGTNYVFDETGVSIRTPYEGIYVKSNN